MNNNQQKLTKKQIQAKEEERIKKNYSERAYLQHCLDKELRAVDSIKFSQKFMLIAFGIFSLVLIVSLFIDLSTFWLILTIIVCSVFIASLIWFIVYKTKYKPIRDKKIAEIRAKLQVYNNAEQEKLQKISQMINKQSKE